MQKWGNYYTGGSVDAVTGRINYNEVVNRTLHEEDVEYWGDRADDEVEGTALAGIDGKDVAMEWN